MESNVIDKGHFPFTYQSLLLIIKNKCKQLCLVKHWSRVYPLPEWHVDLQMGSSVLVKEFVTESEV